MLLLKYVFVILHILTAASWFGLSLPLARRARVVAGGGAGAAELAADGARTVKLLGVFSVLTLLFALGAFASGIMAQGTDAYGWPYHAALLLVLGLVGATLALIRPGWNALQGGDLAAAKRVAMGAGIGHTLWLVILVLMFWSDLEVALLAL